VVSRKKGPVRAVALIPLAMVQCHHPNRFGQDLASGFPASIPLDFHRELVDVSRYPWAPPSSTTPQAPSSNLGRGFEHFGISAFEKGQARLRSCQAFSMIYRLNRQNKGDKTAK